MSSQTPRVPHVLEGWNPEWIHDWKHWGEVWKGTQLTEVRLGLVHCGFMVNCRDETQRVDRVCFYFDLADCHLYPEKLKHPDERPRTIYDMYQTPFGSIQNLSSLRQRVSEKAFQFLATNYFKSHTDWAQYFHYPQLLNRILFFLRPRQHYGDRFENIFENADYPHMQHAYDFAFRFCKYVWQFTPRTNLGDEGESQRAVLKRFMAVRPHIIRILHMLKRLDFLLVEEKGSPIDLPSLLTLKEIAFEKRLMLPHRDRTSIERLPETLEEAVVGGSAAAQVLHTIIIRERMHQRLRKIAKTEEQKREAERTIAQLQ